MVLEKTLECPLDSKEIKPVNPEGSQLRIFTGKSDAEAPLPFPSPGDLPDPGMEPVSPAL